MLFDAPEAGSGEAPTRGKEADDGYRRNRLDDVTLDLISVQHHSLKPGHDYGRYVRDAKDIGLDDIAQFFRQVMKGIPRALRAVTS
jgi:hypothetical protein